MPAPDRGARTRCSTRSGRRWPSRRWPRPTPPRPTGGRSPACRSRSRTTRRWPGRRARAARAATGRRQTADAEVVRRLRAAGAIPIGITNVPELMIFPWTATDANGITRNPWDLNRTPGGSSGGSAAAVAAGMVPWRPGRTAAARSGFPAGGCGLVGMKPTRGRVSTMPSADGWLGLSTCGGAGAHGRRQRAAARRDARPAAGRQLTRRPPFDGSYVDAAATAAGAAADRDLAQAPAGPDRQGLGRSARGATSGPGAAVRARPRRARARPGVRA